MILRYLYHKAVMKYSQSPRYTIFSGLFLVFVLVWIVFSSDLNPASTLMVKPVPLKYVVLHLDFKGAPLNVGYLVSILPALKRLKVNALLLEYEDMFPYRGRIANISTPFRYTDSQLGRFLQVATLLGFELIPLVQTFGHMEHVLKLEEFQHLRELPKYPDSICPSKTESLEVIEDMLKQVITYHQKYTTLKFIHIGCDEVWSINSCEYCRKRNTNQRRIFFSHVGKVAKIVKKFLPYGNILIWDDMMRSNVQNFVKEMKILATTYNIQPVYWDYTPELSLVKNTQLYFYHNSFGGIWAASAFKGADGVDLTTPWVPLRLLNNLNWLLTIYQNKRNYKFHGIILTGWSRYSHFEPLCELLPLSYRSLVPTLVLISKFNYGILAERKKKFTNASWDMVSKNFLADTFDHLDACGKLKQAPAEICALNSAFVFQLRKSIKDLMKDVEDAEFLINAKAEAIIKFEYYKNMSKIYVLRNSTVNIERRLSNKKAQVKRMMKHFYGENVYNEYLSYKMYVVNMRLKRLSVLITDATKKIVWKRGREFVGDYSPRTAYASFKAVRKR